MKSLESLRLVPVWVTPEHTIDAARILMQGYKVRLAGVVSERRLVGTVALDDLLGHPDDIPVGEVMNPLTTVFAASDHVRDVAKMFIDRKIEWAPVTCEGRFSGIVTSSMLLRELNRSWDPMTDLSWSDYLREWGAEKLAKGQEICVMFIDLNQFGQFNKQFNHHIGDQVLKMVARTLESQIDPEQDVLVRYGGDEFAIGTVRSREEAEELAQKVMAFSGALQVAPEIPAVGFSLGMYGGRRTKIRPEDNISATLDNLIRHASEDALSKKPKPEAASTTEENMAQAHNVEGELPQQAPAERPNVALLEVIPGDHAPGAMSQVMITVAGTVSSGVSSKGAGTLMEAVANATAKALENGFPGQRVQIRELQLAEPDDTHRTVTVKGVLVSQSGSKPIAATHSVNGDIFASAAEATLLAFTTGLDASK